MSYEAESVGRLLARRPDWFDRARCRPVDGVVDPGIVDMFFPTSSDMVTTHRDSVDVIRPYEEGAKAVCRGCPVRTECLEFGLDEPTGIWGGRTLRERVYIRRRLRGATA